MRSASLATSNTFIASAIVVCESQDLARQPGQLPLVADAVILRLGDLARLDAVRSKTETAARSRDLTILSIGS